MNDNLARAQMFELLERYTAGSILHLLSEIYEQAAKEAESAGDVAAYERYKMLGHALFVVGQGIDSTNPS
ncbi:hypothetical protein [Bremerella alba]|uniref:Uncharacterized protein n=1 Tax=Bremerella alba TaxID=980252 RepID=A0A7V9A8V1_9BACT|nr:hypothetical protein [Bremerella alba]MBA2116678.1 hypothetical protein [Bremerella alba]